MTNDDVQFLAKKRWRKEIKRRAKKKSRRAVEQPVGREGSYKSPLLNLFAGSSSISRTTRLPAKTFKAPRIFSISRNPKPCLRFIQDIVEYSRQARRPRVVLDQREIVDLGLGADSILGIVLSEIRREAQHIVGSYIRGYKPKARNIQNLMDEVGSVRALFMQTEEDILLSFRSKARVFRHRHRASLDAMSTARFDPAAKVVSDFSDHLDQVLALTGRALSVEGRAAFCQYAAEILDNIKEHAGLSEWAVVGYVDPEDDLPIYRCVIFSFGRTISETFLLLPEGSYPLKVIQPYLSAHRGGSLFGDDWREQDLITLIALQGDVSSKNTGPETDRGQGTVELIEFFQSVSLECGIRQHPAEMNVISGSTRIRFDGRYQMQFREDLRRDVIAFNPANDLNIPPDRSAVIAMKDCMFPGTLITIEIPLTLSFMEVRDAGHEYQA